MRLPLQRWDSSEFCTVYYVQFIKWFCSSVQLGSATDAFTNVKMSDSVGRPIEKTLIRVKEDICQMSSANL